MADPILQIKNLAKSFGALKATDDVSIDLRAGEIHALIGPNGAGKSTLIKQIVGEVFPDQGQILYQGQDITALDPASRARLGLARSFQVSSVLPEFSVLQNVMLAVAGASGRIYRFFKPASRDKSLTEPAMSFINDAGLQGREQVVVANLSHGERRKLEIAMALALRPQVFLLDEPMAGMGIEGSKQLTGLLQNLKRQAPILLVEHDMDAVFALADRISVLVYGRVIASGSVAEIRANAEVRRSYLGDE